MLLMVYPIFETLFSIYRKKFLRGHSPGDPDGLHLHMLIYKRLIRSSASSGEHGELTRRNSAVAAYVWAISAMCALPALVFWKETPWLVAFSLFFCACYVWLYRRITRWKAPKWIIRTG
jgi:UDP-N-acetylmuramyl pentapeptide phosphotransferase/UDP-N-acetylglucosamine-1-phosphate transferase